MKRSFFVSLTALILVGLILVILAGCGSSPSPVSVRQEPPNKWANVTYTGEDERLLEGTIWVFPFIENATLEFRRGGRLVVNARGWQGNASWKRTGDTVEFVMNNGFIYFEGIYYPETQRILGTAHDSYNHVSDQTMVPAGSSIATPTSPSSTTNVYVQPSAPAQSPTPTPAPSTPTFQPGRYAFSGSNITMSLLGYQATAYSGYEQVAWGTYRINGNQIVITFNTGSGAGASLQGKTFAYTITSNTSFSGSGETWVRTGY